MIRRPLFLLVPGLVGLAFIVIPPLALLVQAPWASMTQILTSDVTLSALRLSLIVSLVATGIAFVVGTPLAWLLANEALPWTRLWRALVIVPLLLPPVVSGVALLTAFGRRGPIGGPVYDLFGVQLPFSTAAVVLASAFVAMPFLVITMEGAFRSVDREVEEAATVDGASPRRVFWRITLPLVGPSLVAGTVLAWARAIGEFGATITFAGNLEGVTQTMPLAVYAALESDRDVAIGMSVILVLISVGILVALRGNYLPRSRRAA
jgi:molybdate transport system permease protein